MSRPRLCGVGPGMMLLALALSHPWLERRMYTHIVVELPLLFAVGWWAAGSTSSAGPSWLRHVNANGITGLTAATVISAIWMLPIALDAAVLSVGAGCLKVASLVVAGWLTRLSLREARTAVQAFFVLNWVWMTGAAGAVYQQTRQQLCSTYLLGDQPLAGMGLVTLAILVATFWVTSAFREAPATAWVPLGKSNPDRGGSR